MTYLTVKEMREFLKRVPKKFDNYMVANGQVYLEGPIGNQGAFSYRVDEPIITVCVDQITEKLCFLSQTQTEVREIVDNGNSTGHPNRGVQLL